LKIGFGSKNIDGINMDTEVLHGEIKTAFAQLRAPSAVETWLKIRALLADAIREESEQQRAACHKLAMG